MVVAVLSWLAAPVSIAVFGNIVETIPVFLTTAMNPPVSFRTTPYVISYIPGVEIVNPRGTPAGMNKLTPTATLGAGIPVVLRTANGIGAGGAKVALSVAVET